MSIAESQMEAICQKVRVRRPCVSCGYDGDSNQPFIITEMDTVAVSTDGDKPLKSKFAVFSCPQCGYTTFINVSELFPL